MNATARTAAALLAGVIVVASCTGGSGGRASSPDGRSLVFNAAIEC